MNAAKRTNITTQATASNLHRRLKKRKSPERTNQLYCCTEPRLHVGGNDATQRVSNPQLPRLRALRAKSASKVRDRGAARRSVGQPSSEGGRMPSTTQLDTCGRRRSPATLSSFHQGRPP